MIRYPVSNPIKYPIINPVGVPSVGFSSGTVAGLQLWLKADTGTYQDSAKTTPAVSDADVIGAWEDQSGNGNDALQSTTANKPLLKLAIANSRSVIRFDGTNDFLSVALDLALTAGDDLTIFFVSNPVDDAATKVILGNQIDSGDRQGLLIFHNSDEKIDWTTRRNTGDQTSIIASVADTDFVLGVSQLDGGTQELFKNGVTEGSGVQRNMTGHAATTFIGINRSGGGAFYDGDIPEILIYDSALSTANRQLVENYLNGKYATF